MLLAEVPPQDLAPVILGVVCLAVAGFVTVVSVVAIQWKHVRVAAFHARLKQLMIERGLSASDIERVISADPKIAASRSEWEGLAGIMRGGSRKANSC